MIAELGFGTGLNLLAAWDAWMAAGITTPLQFVSFEAFPMALEDMRQSLIAWPELVLRAGQMLGALNTQGFAFTLDGLSAEIVIGDARGTVPAWDGAADAWFLDGFSPAKNPELWEASLMKAVADHTRKGGTVATYSAAGHVREKLTDAGFNVERVPGFGRKRHMTRGVKR